MTLRFERLTRVAIRQLRVGGALSEHGITVEKVTSGDVRYVINVMVDGRRVHRAIGFASAGVTRTQCEQAIEGLRTDARSGRLNLPKKRKLALTFAAAADDYVRRLAESAGKNIVRKRSQLNRKLKPFFGKMRLDAVTTFTVDRYKKKRTGEAMASGTVNRELATLSHLFSMAVEWKWLDRVPCRPKILEESRGRIVALTDAQCDALMRAAVASADSYCWLFVAFGLNTAMRHAEILAARFDKLDLDNLRLFIPDAKAGHREQPITRELAELLRREREQRDDPEGWVFPARRKDCGSGHYTRMDRPFRDAVIAAGLDPKIVTPHVMRHTAITALVKAGVDLPTIQRISGHKKISMVLRYTHVHGSHIDDAIRKIGRTLPELGANETSVTITPKLHQTLKHRSA